MKKVVISISVLVYLLVSCGVIVNFHYCMNKLDSTQFFTTETDVCGKCGMHIDDAEGCCRDEVRIIKLVDDQQPNSIPNFEFPTLSPAIQIPSAYIVASFTNDREDRHYNNHSPPLLNARDTYLLNSVFRI